MPKKTEKSDVVQLKLKLAERIHLGNILPEKGGLSTMLTRKSLVDKVIVTPEDMERVGWTDREDGTATWDEKRDLGRNYSFTGLEIELIVRQLRKLNEDEALLPAHLGLWELFVEKQQEA